MPRIRLRTWHTATVLLAAWLGLSLGWSWFLISSSFEQSICQRMQDRADRIAAALRDRVPPPATLPSGPGLEAAAGDPALMDYVDWDRKPDPHIAYIMLWDPKGKIIAHTQPDQIDGRLDPAQWPVLAHAAGVRFTHRRTVPWAPRTPRLLEVTVPVRARESSATIGYVSVGVQQSWISEQFWASQSGILSQVAVVTAGGAAMLLLAVQYVRLRNRRIRETHEQQVRARTSLLTERGMLASVLAHEVRSPLTALRFNLHSLRNLLARVTPTSNAPSDPPADVRDPELETRNAKAESRTLELTDLCEREIRRLDLMLNDFLTRTQIISPPARTSVNQVVREALDFLDPALERKHIRTIMHFDPADPLVTVNADELRQVLLNLAANAQDAIIQAKSPSGGTLAVSTLAEEHAVTLLVRDSGIGIPEELQHRIFEPFFTTKPHGSGLGLALVRRVISGAGGTIFCESTPSLPGKGGGGTTFRIVLPRAVEVTVSPPTSDGVQPDPMPAASETSPPDDPPV